jgi:hypothetical protein
MRTAVVALFLVLAGCINLDSTTTGPTTSVAAPPRPSEPGLGTLYLHADTTRTWMDASRSGGTVDTPLAAVQGMGPGGAVFRMDPASTTDVVTAGFAVVHLQSAAPLQSAQLTALLFVDGAETGRASSSGAIHDLILKAPTRIEAGQAVELAVCLCMGTGGFVLDTRGNSWVDFPLPAEGSLAQGAVSVRPDGNRFRAERTDVMPIEVSVSSTDVETVNGDVLQLSDEMPRIEARLWARGATEQEARDRLETLFVQFQSEPDLVAHVRTTLVDGDAWSHMGASVDARLAAGTRLSASSLATVNGNVRTQDVPVGSLVQHSTNGDLVAAASANSWTARTTNGGIRGDLAAPDASGSFELRTTNGQISLRLQQSGNHGVDAEASTTNGQVGLAFAGAEPVGSQSRTSAHVRTTGYDGKAVQTGISMRTTNGDVSAGDS